MTAWWREGEVPLLWTLPRGFKDVQLSPRIVFTAPLSGCIVIEKCILLRVRSDSPPLYCSLIFSLGKGRDSTGYSMKVPSTFNNFVRSKFGAQLIFSQDNVV